MSPIAFDCGVLHYDRDAGGPVNGSAYMDFKAATDALFSRVDHATLARKLGVSVALIRQARLKPDASASRSPPPDWRNPLIRLAEDRARHFNRLAERLRRGAAR